MTAPPPVLVTERGWGGHYHLNWRCRWRRNTLLELGDRRLVVTSVGRCFDKEGNELMTIGANGRTMETMTFVAQWEAPYWEADVTRTLSPWTGDVPWFSLRSEREATAEYELIHEKNVAYWARRLQSLTDEGWARLTAKEDI